MSKFAALAGGQTGVLVGGALVVAAVVGTGMVLFQEGAEPVAVEVAGIEPDVVPVVLAPEPEPPVVAVDPKPQAPTEPAVAEAPEPVPEPIVPSFDEIRTENDGLTVIAGHAVPGSKVHLVVDGIDTTHTDAQSNGAFALVAFLDVSDRARVLTLRQVEGETSTVSSEEIILAPTPKPAPIPKPVVVATAPEAAEVAEAPVIEPTTQTAETKTTEPTEPAPTEVAEASTPQIAPVSPQVVPAVTADTPANDPLADQAQDAEADVAPIQSTAQTTTSEPLDTAEIAQVDSGDSATQSAAVTSKPVAAPETVAEVPAPAAPPAEAPETEVAVLKADESGVEIVNRSSAPEVMSNVAIDTISYSDLGDVLLSGRAQAQAEVVRVYLNNAPVTTLKVDPAGRWRGDLPDVDTGIYTLRVDEVNAGGTVTSRVETPFKREDPVVLAEAKTEDTQPISAITVQTGATLWAIARDRYGDGTLYVRVVAANAESIKDPDLIYPGQIFDLPNDP